MKKRSFASAALIICACLLFSSCAMTLRGEKKIINGYFAKRQIDDFRQAAALCLSDHELDKYDFSPFIEAPAESCAELCQKLIGLEFLWGAQAADTYGYCSELLGRVKELLPESEMTFTERAYSIYALKLAGEPVPDGDITALAKEFADSCRMTDVDDLAFMMPVLIYAREKDPSLAESVDKLCAVLKRLQNKNDTFSQDGVENSRTTALALSAFAAMGLGTGDDCVVNGVMALQTFRQADGGYSYQRYGASDPLSSALALFAFCETLDGGSFWLSVLNNEAVFL